LVLVCGCGRIGFDPPAQTTPIIDAGGDGNSGGEMTTIAPCLTSQAYAMPQGLSRRYREGNALVTWAAARAACMADGADLWVPTTLTEAITLTGDWVGITDVASEGVWLTVDGDLATFLPWEAGQPDGGQAEDCARNASGSFEDRDCTDLRDYVCECDAGSD
jgi:hypothetical protein